MKSQAEYNDVLARKQPQDMNSRAIRQQVASNGNNLNMASFYLRQSKWVATWHHNKTWYKQTMGVPPVQSPSQVGLDRVPEVTQELTCDE